MDYFLNEFSLTGQFESIDAFYESFYQNTFYVLKKIDSDNNKVFKDEKFWDLKISDQFTVYDALYYRGTKNNRNSRLELLNGILNKIVKQGPYFQNDCDDPNILILEHAFDSNPNIDNTEKLNSIYHVAGDYKNRRLVSFEHSCYSNWNLRVKIMGEDSNPADVDLQNIYSGACWGYVKEIKKWPLVADEYWIEVRACEFTYHKPHFHVSSKHTPNQEMTFAINDCSIVEQSDKKGLYPWENKMYKAIQKWFSYNKHELENAWKMLHPPAFKQ